MLEGIFRDSSGAWEFLSVLGWQVPRRQLLRNVFVASESPKFLTDLCPKKTQAFLIRLELTALLSVRCRGVTSEGYYLKKFVDCSRNVGWCYASHCERRKQLWRDLGPAKAIASSP